MLAALYHRHAPGATVAGWMGGARQARLARIVLKR
jgi:hypothetical protein